MSNPQQSLSAATTSFKFAGGDFHSWKKPIARLGCSWVTRAVFFKLPFTNLKEVPNSSHNIPKFALSNEVFFFLKFIEFQEG